MAIFGDDRPVCRAADRPNALVAAPRLPARTAALHPARLTAAGARPTMPPPTSRTDRLSQTMSKAALTAIGAGSFIVLLSFGIRSSFGLFLQPMSMDLGSGREVFALAMAIQNLVWGAAQPLIGMIADRFGVARTVAAGALLYAAALYLMATAASAFDLHLSAGLLIGLALGGTGFGVVLAAVGRAVPTEARSMALGLTTAIGSFGQFVMPPIGQALISGYGWQTTLLLFALGSLLMMAAAAGLRSPRASGAHAHDNQTLGSALSEASHHAGYLYLTAGFFVCGWHVAFIAVHLPAYLADGGISAGVAAWCLALVGLFNVIGSYCAGVLGGRVSKKYCLSFLYAARSLLILVFIMVPLSLTSALVFSAIMGLLWLSTVPLTSGLVAQIFGLRYMATLFGIVFLSHQVGSFLGVWLGGYLYDTYGSYDLIWWLSIALGLIAALLHWPIDERAVARLRAQA
jgi:predicted MFS family arabinose efflux permease